MARFFVAPEAVDRNSGRITISGGDVNHIKNVLRLDRGGPLEISDGACNEYDVVINTIERERIITAIREVRRNRTEPPIEVTLYQAVPKSDKLDTIIQKCVELGVVKIVPVITERTVVRFDGGRDASAKTSRWRKISLEAAKQCGRGIIPHVAEPVRFDAALDAARGNELCIIPYENESTSGLAGCLRNGKYGTIAVFIGPEGGFAEAEIRKAEAAGVRPVTLGPRILRTETAGPVVLSILMYELGDM